MGDKLLSEELKTTGRALALTNMDAAQALDTARFMEKQAKEIERLRKALTDIASCRCVIHGDTVDIARKALEDE